MLECTLCKVRHPVLTRPRLFKARIGVTLLMEAADLAATDDVARLAAQPNVEQDDRPHPIGTPRLGAFENCRPVGPFTKTVEQLDRPRRDVVVSDGVYQPGAAHQDALREKFTDARQSAQLRQGVRLGKGPEPRSIERLFEGGPCDLVKALDLRRRHGRKALEPKQRSRIRKRLECGALNLDRRADFLGHPLSDAPRLKDRDPMSDDEGTGRLIGRVKEHGSKVSILRLQPPDDGVAASAPDETLTINAERDPAQPLPPGAVGINVAGTVDFTGDGVATLAHQH